MRKMLTQDRGRWLLLGYGGVLLLVLIEIENVTHKRQAAAGGTLAVTAIIAAVWVALLIRFQRDRKSVIGPLLIAILGAASVVLAILSPQGAAIIPCIVALSLAANRLDRVPGIVFATALIASYTTAIAFLTKFNFITVLSLGLGLVFAFIATSSVARLREEESRAKALLAELQASRDAQVQAAALNERARIAREIHDVLAHTLAAEAVQLEGARLLLQKANGEPQAPEAVERAHRLTREGLDEVRRAVSALRGDQIPGPDQLRELVQKFETDTGVEADFKIEGASRPLSAEAQLALYRAAQEALTNVRRHAEASRVEVALRYDETGTELLVQDVGKVRDSPNGRGYGLMGMRERAELLGGTVEAGPTGDGFRVRLWIPV